MGTTTKALGIVRNVDELGRIVIPKEFRKTHGWLTGTPIEMFATEQGLLLQEYAQKERKDAARQSLQQLMELCQSNREALELLSEVDSYIGE